jgi:4-amino-4-deoxy-L-arabinose transferase-like glycosyltransferase
MKASPKPAEKQVPLFLLLDKEQKNDLLMVVLLIALAAVVRIYSVQFFYVIPTDGTSYVETARAFNRGEWRGIGSYGFYSVLIAFAGRLITDLETAGKFVSLVFGSLLPLPLYLLGKELFSRRVALAASLVVIVSPALIFSSCQVITQATYTTLVLAGVYLVWRLFRQPSIVNGSLAGLCIGFAYFTRAEAILLFLVLPLSLCLYKYREVREKWSVLAAYAGGFLLILGLNTLLVHAVTGEWQLSSKTDAALNDALSYYLNKPDLNYVPGYEPKGYLDIMRDHPGFVVKNTVLNLKSSWETMLPFWGWLLFFAGFFSGGFKSERNMIRLFLLSTFAPLAVLIVFYYIGGYTDPYLPVLLLLAATGFDHLCTLLREKLHAAGNHVPAAWLGRFPVTIIVAAVYAAVLFVPQIRKPVPDSEYLPEADNYRRAEKNLGLLLKDSLPPGKIMTRWARIAFYAEREWVNIPNATPCEEVIKLARKSGVRFFIADGTLYGNRPELGMELFEPLTDENLPFGKFFHEDPDARVKGMRPFMLYTDPKSMGVVVYEIPESG